MFSIPPHIPNHIVTMIFATLIFMSCPPCEFHLVARTVLNLYLYLYLLYFVFVSCPPGQFHLVTRTVLPKVEKQIALADIIMIMKRGILDDVDDLSVYVDGGMIKNT